MPKSEMQKNDQKAEGAPAESRPITDEDWEEIGEIMERPYGHAKLWVDGFEVQFQQEIYKRRLVTLTYVNGEMKGAWMLPAQGTAEPKHEEARRFYQPRSRGAYSAKTIKDIQKAWGKREAKKYAKRRQYWFDPKWKSAKSLRKHLESNNKEIRVIELFRLL